MKKRLISLLVGALALAGCKDKPPTPLMVMTGDSIIATMAPYQSGLPEPFKSAKNIAISGAKAEVIAQQTEAFNPAYRILLLEGGGNNGFFPPDAIYQLHAYMLVKVPLTTKIIMLGIAPMDRGDPNEVVQIASINQTLNTMCRDHPNCTPAIAAQNVNMSGLTIDGTHPSPQGFIALTNALLPLMQ